MKLICFGAALLLSATSFSQSLAVSDIPAALLLNANAVTRYDDTKLIIDNPSSATMIHKYAITILNKAGEDDADFVIGYDKLNPILDIDGYLYDAGGKKIKSVKRSDIQDFSGTSEGTLADDNRIKHHNFYCREYPYTVVYETREQFKGTFYFPRWMPISHSFLAVQQSSLSVECPIDYQLRYKAFQYDQAPEIQEDKRTKTYHWQVAQLAAIRGEIYMPALHEVVPSVMLAPTDFNMQDYNGNMSSWNGLGKFLYALNNNRDELPEPVKQKVHELTDGIPDVKKKIAILYKYMQQNTRYISVQLGIGGWQTFDAKYVAGNGYGDCKALSNYMHSLLKEVGIKSNWAVIYAGSNKKLFIPDFPSNQFNHMILCVPQSKDSVWLECTSQTLDPGYLSSFTSNRYALVIDENGGNLVKTPIYNKDQNRLVRTVVATIDEGGNLSAQIHTIYTAEQQDDIRQMIDALNKEKITEYLRDELSLPSYDVVSFNYTPSNPSLPVITEQLAITAPNYAAITGKRLFITPNLLNKSNTKISRPEERKFPLLLQDEFTDIDSVTYQIPAGFVAESVPAPVKIDGKYGKYHAEVKVVGNQLLYTRQYIRWYGKYEPKEALDLAAFFEKIYKADRAKVVLVKNAP